MKESEILKKLKKIKEETNENEIFHELCLIFPFKERLIVDLVLDIEKEDLQEPIKRYNGKILDGRHRWYACKILGILPLTIHLPLTIKCIKYVKSHNLKRRHLTTGERVFVSLGLDKWIPIEFKKNNIVEKREDLLHTEKMAKEAETTPIHVKKAKRLLIKSINEPKIEKIIEKIKKDKLSLDKGYNEVFNKKKSSKKKDEVRIIENWKKKYLDLNSLYIKIVNYLKEKNMWEEYKKENFPIAEKKVYLGPTIKEIRKSRQ